LDELQAAALRVKLPYLAAWNDRRRDLAARYARGLQGTAVIPLAVRPEAQPVFHQYTVRTPERDELRTYLSERGIETAVHYPLPLHRQPALSRLPSARQAYPVSERAALEVLCLPVAPEIADRDVDRVIAAIREFAAKF